MEFIVYYIHMWILLFGIFPSRINHLRKSSLQFKVAISPSERMISSLLGFSAFSQNDYQQYAKPVILQIKRAVFKRPKFTVFQVNKKNFINLMSRMKSDLILRF
uniref:Uncharacterized protein n=1 Tax=Lutzomyia longipalpis TaxID=7200 RepID=A0A1B0EVR1_LUTLO